MIPGQPPTRPSPHDAEFASGRAGEHPFAVMYQGEYETPWDGTATAVRLHARALAGTGIPVLLRSFSGLVTDEYGIPESVHIGGLPAAVRKEIGDLDRTTARAFFPVVKHLVVRDADHLKRVIIPKGAIARGGVEADIIMRKHIHDSTIVYSVWERDRIDPAIARILSRVAECWVPCLDNAHMLVASGVPEEKVFVIPHPHDPADPILKLIRRQPNPGWKKFYSIGRWEPRKGYAALLEAFVGAFRPTDQATLAIKYTGGKWPGYPTPEEAVQIALARDDARQNGWTAENFPTRVHLVEGRFPRPAILKIHYMNNIYVSSSHGEAWCLPAYEAALAGNALVYVPSGGIQDFACASDIQVPMIPDATEPVPVSYGWESDAGWASYSVAELRYALLHVCPPNDHAYRSNQLQDFTLEAVGKLMRHRILQVAGKVAAAGTYYSP